jgi:hypothetical protein
VKTPNPTRMAVLSVSQVRESYEGIKIELTLVRGMTELLAVLRTHLRMYYFVTAFSHKFQFIEDASASKIELKKNLCNHF